MAGPLVAFQTGVHGSRPAASSGVVFYNCTTHTKLELSDGASWTDWASLAGSGLTDPMTSRGDIIIRDASNVTARLAKGSSGKVLTSDGTDIAWQTPAGGGSVTHEDGTTHPDTPGTYDEEFEGTADTLPANWSWISTPSTWKLNSQWKSWLIVEHATSVSETKELRRASVTPGAADFGIWWAWSLGLGQWNNNNSWMQLDLLNSGETEGRGFKLTATSTYTPVTRSLIASSEADVTNGPTITNFGQLVYMGMTRKTSDNTWRYYFSMDGITWTQLGGSVAHTFTIDRIRVRFNSGSNVGIERRALDFVRTRADLLLHAPR